MTNSWLGLATCLSPLLAACFQPGASSTDGGSQRLPDSGTDACVPTADAGCDQPQGIAPLLEQLAQSEMAWNALVAMDDDTYWYEEENCVDNSVNGDVTTVQVENGIAAITGTRTIMRNECYGRVDRYRAFKARTMEQLYAECSMLIRREGAEVMIQTDAEGVIERCIWPGDPGCSHSCGEGFLLRTRAFGIQAD